MNKTIRNLLITVGIGSVMLAMGLGTYFTLRSKTTKEDEFNKLKLELIRAYSKNQELTSSLLLKNKTNQAIVNKNNEDIRLSLPNAIFNLNLQSVTFLNNPSNEIIKSYITFLKTQNNKLENLLN
ncbi:hypothetical protein [Mycoplasma struthionis]|uniref:Uncharacterized protein n=1 Tax=Mycoplasma struthionis TaxID=538220 RepID=A0A3G8LHQ9_9MOLU|nr:hypothetical protein [Mycoplasma struthionis]AZG68765.1 hypothetical protein EGN60_02210 [Mycoplasma struthionis]